MFASDIRIRRAARSLRAAAPLLAMFFLTGAVSVSCKGDASLTSVSGGGGTNPTNAPLSAAMGQWTPNTLRDSCSATFHDSFSVIGPDGKRYPTWHPPTAVDPVTGQLCSFGHEHGDDPHGSAMFDFLRAQFAYDANGNGIIDQTELDVSGVPFGYVQEQLDAYNSASGIVNGARHQDHVAYKVRLSNGVPRVQLVNGQPATFDVRCDVLSVINQDTHSTDAFTNNLHQLTYAIDCNNGADVARYPVKLLINAMAVFGDPGGFTANTPGVGLQFVNVGPATPANSPFASSTSQSRVISTSDNINNSIFVVAGQVSDFAQGLKDSWNTSLVITRFGGGADLATINPGFTSYSPSRYYSPAATDGLARSINLCYTGLNASDQLIDDPSRAGEIVRRARGAECMSVAPNGPSTPAAQRIAFDDPLSPFNGCVREVTLNSDLVRNVNGTTAWYTDPFGQGARTSPFAGSVKQYIAPVDTVTTPITLQTQLLSGNTCVTGTHAPN